MGAAGCFIYFCFSVKPPKLRLYDLLKTPDTSNVFSPLYFTQDVNRSCVVSFIMFVQEDELESQKQQQMVLLQELEEQKAKLEQMLLEAQQEREDLKAAVSQDVPTQQPDVPVRDREVTHRVEHWLNFKALIWSFSSYLNLKMDVKMSSALYVYFSDA